MPLQSKLFALDRVLEECSRRDSACITTDAQGDPVSKIQTALFLLDGVSVASDELQTQTYGPSTAQAVLRFKKGRNIIQADGVVGRATIAAMDLEVAAIEKQIACPPDLSQTLAYV